MSSLPPIPLMLQGVCQHLKGADVLRDVTLSFDRATFNLVRGDAGCSILLRIAGLLDAPMLGDVRVAGAGTRELSGTARTELRNHAFGFLFPSPYLLPAMTVMENVAMPLFKISAVEVEEAQRRSTEVLDFVGLADFETTSAGGLSAMNQACAALARGLVHGPQILIVEHADASVNGADDEARFIQLLRSVPARFGTTVLASLAGPIVAEAADRVVMIQDGTVRSDSRLPDPQPGFPS